MSDELESTDARNRWLAASRHATELEARLFQPGDGYGSPEAREADLHLLQSARLQADRMFNEYQDADRRAVDDRLYTLQRSQTLATWASFAVAATVGAATILGIVT